ncbi:glycine dehydrogenase [Paragonimus westermani]|uniref:glycine dehydrogenase (aminomethyl-transferring) n=1 Tax=Paragonimus westermani TaxID=34504 RepID=A0A5J4NTE1_9TREM|nr:glycine dehydrogenase [Paragonimus westermani]
MHLRLLAGFLTAQRRAPFHVGRTTRLTRLLSSLGSVTLKAESPEANFARRHIGLSDDDAAEMLKVCGYKNIEELVSQAIPKEIRLDRDLNLEDAISEAALLQRIETIMNKNQVWRSYIGQGYYGTLTPTPILRNIFENPGWYTSYTPYQPEISQGRLEALLNFQTVVSELTGLPLANASLLDEGTSAAEAMAMANRKTGRTKVLVDSACHPQTIAVVRSRADGLNLEVKIMDFRDTEAVEKLLATGTFAGCLMQYPDTNGNLCDEKVAIISKIAKNYNSLTTVATDLLALTLVQSPGELGADIAIGSAQRFGVPMGFGGPHAGFFATREQFARLIPGRVIGISKDAAGKPALRLTLQVREQHIRRDKATSNICTAQALLASMAGFYAVYHGPNGLKQIATRVHRNTMRLAVALCEAGYQICNDSPVFDTLQIKPSAASLTLDVIKQRAAKNQINLRYYPEGETPCSWPTVNRMHPFVPVEQTKGYLELIEELERDLAEVTGYDHVCLAPNSGAQGEYSGLRAITGYLSSKGENKRKVCLIPTSAHGTNPASARMAGMNVQPVNSTKKGGFDMGHLKQQVDRFKDTLGAIMITYPSTFGVFDNDLMETCELVHKAGGQVYLDGANLNAQVGLCRPGDYGTDVCHLNLHKTFGIPHGGGGPGVGPVCVKSHLAPFLPQHPWRSACLNVPVKKFTLEPSLRTVCAAPFGSASILPIPWAYLKLLGPKGVRKASEAAILNANYMLRRLQGHYPIKFVNQNGCCAHEFIVDCSAFEKYHITTLDIAKRLMDYGFHSPTMSWPVASSLMIEPTESESRAECDRLCDALIGIRQEIDKVIQGEWSSDCSPLKMAPHTLEDVTKENWDRPYSRQEAAFPAPWHRPGKVIFDKLSKVWPSVGRLDDAYGDTHLSCKTPIKWD